jgi:aspartyl-tRNA synthetase
MSSYGVDKPDRRFGMEIHNLTDFFKTSTIKQLRDTVDTGGKICAFNLGSSLPLTRKQGDEIVTMASAIKALKYEKGKQKEKK